MFDDEDIKGGEIKFNEKEGRYVHMHKLAAEPTTEPKLKPAQGKLLLPWWFRIVGHVFCNAAIVTSAVFIIIMGIQFGEAKVQRWLACLFISLLSSIIFCQPIQVGEFKIGNTLKKNHRNE